MCGSSQQAIHSASQQILAGNADIVVDGGVENMSRIPMGTDMGGFSDDLVNQYNIIPQGFSAEMIASQWEVTREELDELSLESHRRAAEATDNGQFKREILPVTIDGEEFSDDEGIRSDTSLEKLGGITPSFQPADGVISAGEPSPMRAGASGLLLMSDTKAAELNIDRK